MIIRNMGSGEEEGAVALIKASFDRFVGCDYPPYGIREFYRYANAKSMAERQREGHFTLLAEEKGQLSGVLEMRLPGHICLLFVAPGQMRKGIATALLQRAVGRCVALCPGLTHIEVNASSYGEVFYKGFGFVFTGPREEKNGIVFTPMSLGLQGDALLHPPVF